MKATCFECGRPATVGHHVVPKSMGGTRTIPLCDECHQKAHQAAIGTPRLTKEGLRKKKRRGERTGSVPYGFTLAVDGVHLLLDETEQAAVAAAREYSAAGLSLREIGQRLDAEGHRPRGKRWYAQTVKNILAAEVPQ